MRQFHAIIHATVNKKTPMHHACTNMAAWQLLNKTETQNCSLFSISYSASLICCGHACMRHGIKKNKAMINFNYMHGDKAMHEQAGCLMYHWWTKYKNKSLHAFSLIAYDRAKIKIVIMASCMHGHAASIECRHNYHFARGKPL